MRFVKIPDHWVWVNPADISHIAVGPTSDDAYKHVRLTMHNGQSWTWKVHDIGVDPGYPAALDVFFRTLDLASRA